MNKDIQIMYEAWQKNSHKSAEPLMKLLMEERAENDKETRLLAEQNFNLLQNNIIQKGEVDRLKKLNYSVMKINYLLSENLKPF